MDGAATQKTPFGMFALRPPRRVVGVQILAAVVPLVSSCTSFATVRSAEVFPGPSVAVQGSVSTPPGDIPGWFWSFDCVQSCDHPIVGGDAGVTYGWQRDGGSRPFALGAGMNGVHPYVDGYLQLNSGRRPFGIGLRVGPPITSWREHQLYARYDVKLNKSTRLLLNPALFVHEGRAPNGASPGSFIGFVQGAGLLFEGDYISVTPAVALVAGRAYRNSYGERYGPVGSVFGAASLGVTFHRPRAPESF